MKDVIAYLHSYIFALLQPAKTHDWLKHGIAPWAAMELPPRPELVPSIGASWALAILQGLSKIALAGVLLKLLIQFQQDSGLGFAMNEMAPYYFLVISTALDLIFFPITALVVTQFWNLIIRGFGRMLGIESEERQKIADQVTVVALSSNFFLVLPIAGVFLQKIAWLYLMYRGLRKNLGAGRFLSMIILVTPSVIMAMIFSFLALALVAMAKGMV